MLTLLINGGPVLWLIMAISLAGIAIIVERLLFFKKVKSDEGKLFERIRTSLEKEHFDEALSICDNNLSPLGAILRAGIDHREEGTDVLREIMKDAMSQEIPRLEKNVSALDTIAHISPLLGLLGTVTGTMKAFGVLGTFGAVTDPTFLAKGISEALVTTVAGILVAVPAVVCHNWFVGKVDNILIRLEYQVSEIVLLIRPKTGEQP